MAVVIAFVEKLGFLLLHQIGYQMQEQGDDRSQKLRAAVREAIAVLQAALE